MFLRPVVSEKVTVYRHIDTYTELIVFKNKDFLASQVFSKFSTYAFLRVFS